jgi:3-phosphoshikimate 1-carboxyvinyltransferase
MLENITISPKGGLSGVINIPGDKSISHRSVMFAALASTPVVIKNFLYAEDCLSTVSCMQALGAKIEKDEHNHLHVLGQGLHGLKEPENILDAGNSGTTLRLLSGILVGQSFFSVLTGDASLRGRPMGRVVTPLTMMGGKISGRQDTKYVPISIMKSEKEKIHGIEYNMPMASAQVKSAILLATLFASSPSIVTEPYVSRDHTELMLETFGVKVERRGTSISVGPVAELYAPTEINVPGDISSAAFWLVGATIIPNSHLTLKNVGINPTRTGILEVLKEMGANITIENQRLSGAEPVADLVVKSAELKGVTIEGPMIPRLIDEIPILAVAALFAQGQTIIRGAEELRVKETDRLKAVASELGKMGAIMIETKDGLIIDGPQELSFSNCNSYHDHRMAMSLAIAGAASMGVNIHQPACANISYPNFFTTLDTIRA